MTEATKELHDSLIIMDEHCDTASYAAGYDFNGRMSVPYDLCARNQSCHIDFPRLIEGGVGMIVDVLRLCDQALDEVLAAAQRPVVAPHSNSRAVVPHRRNLTDDQAERIAATGGLVADHVGLGTDSEGFTAAHGLVMPDCIHLSALTVGLVSLGYAEQDIRAIMGGNWLRVADSIFS